MRACREAGSVRDRAPTPDRAAPAARVAALAAALLAACSPAAEERAVRAAEPAPAPAPALAAPAPTAAAAEPAAAPDPDLELTPPLVLRVTRPDTSDWPEIARRGVLRVLVTRDRTNFFVAEGRLRGLEYELCHELEQAIAQTSGSARPRVDVAFVPVPFDQLLPALVQGLGDVAAAGLTITPEREQLVAFTEPYLSGVAQIVVSNRGAPLLASLEDLSGRSLCVAPGTSYVASLARLNAQLAAAGRAPVRVETLDTELVHAGAFAGTVADHHVAEAWAGVLDGLRLEPALQLASGDRIAWAVRRENPELKRVLDAFLRENRKGTRTGNVLFQRYFLDTRWIRDPAPDLRAGRLAPILEPLQRLSAQYGFDWRLIAAQAYQESRLDPEARSKAGAIGLMQLLPATARDMGFEDVTRPEDNLHAGIRYMAWLRDEWLADPKLSASARVDFALAAYNAGPGRVRRWRAEAPEHGVDPDRWFGEVENLALESVGAEPVRYVANIHKYYVLLVRLLQEDARSAAARNAAAGAPR
jgi:membrane-bound lytic murein transglycosylase MltF